MTAFVTVDRLIDAVWIYLGLVVLTFTIGFVVLAAFGLRALRRWIARRRDPVQPFAAVTPETAVADTEPGVRLDLRDELELIYSLPSYQGLDLTAGRARLEQAMREQQEGEQP